MSLGPTELLIVCFLIAVPLVVLIAAAFLAVWYIRSRQGRLIGPTKVCPYCKSVIPADATKCRYCASEVGLQAP